MMPMIRMFLNEQEEGLRRLVLLFQKELIATTVAAAVAGAVAEGAMAATAATATVKILLLR